MVVRSVYPRWTRDTYLRVQVGFQPTTSGGCSLGPRATVGGWGLATVVLGAVVCVLLLARRR